MSGGPPLSPPAARGWFGPARPALRDYCARILGWSNVGAVEGALRSLELAHERRAALVLLGEGDIVPVARSLHQRAFGEAPFIVADPCRLPASATVRLPASQPSGLAAYLAAAGGGAVCIRTVSRTLPRDMPELAALVRQPDSAARLVVVGDLSLVLHPFMIQPAPIVIPPLRARAPEVARIVEEFADDAARALNCAALGDDDRTNIAERVRTLADVERATMRLTALRAGGSIMNAAILLQMSGTALAQWLVRHGWYKRRGVGYRTPHELAAVERGGLQRSASSAPGSGLRGR